MTGEDSSAIAAHRETVRAWARAGGPLNPASGHATANNRDWFTRTPDGELQPRAARRELHARLVDEYRAHFLDVRSERKAIILAGPPGAGKSAVLADVLGADRSAWLTVDADEFKRPLLTTAIKDGSYAGAILPPEVRAAKAAGGEVLPPRGDLPRSRSVRLAGAPSRCWESAPGGRRGSHIRSCAGTSSLG